MARRMPRGSVRAMQSGIAVFQWAVAMERI